MSYQDQLQITREVIRRNELAFQENTRILTAVAEHLEQLIEDSRAHTRAIFAVIDRLEGGGAPASG